MTDAERRFLEKFVRHAKGILKAIEQYVEEESKIKIQEKTTVIEIKRYST